MKQSLHIYKTYVNVLTIFKLLHLQQYQFDMMYRSIGWMHRLLYMGKRVWTENGMIE